MKDTTESQVRDAITSGRKLARSEFARVLLMVHRAQQEEDGSCGAYGPGTVMHGFEYGSREAKAIGGMRGHEALERNLTVVDDEDAGVVWVYK